MEYLRVSQEGEVTKRVPEKTCSYVGINGALTSRRYATALTIVETLAMKKDAVSVIFLILNTVFFSFFFLKNKNNLTLVVFFVYSECRYQRMRVVFVHLSTNLHR